MDFKNELINREVQRLWDAGEGIEEYRGLVQENIEWAEDYFKYEDPSPETLGMYKIEMLHYLNGTRREAELLVGGYYQEFPGLNDDN